MAGGVRQVLVVARASEASTRDAVWKKDILNKLKAQIQSF